ncbi:MAG: hypothetical protein MUF34_36320, partial [Polyangiaceae bacterium]|nr:hypothetical protein [Polyangiaceae bacterium]
MSIGRRLRGVALAALAAAATGCDKQQDAAAGPGEWPDDGRWWGEVEGSEVPDKKDNGDDGQRQLELSTEVTRIFGAHCAPCHAGRKGIVLGDFDDIYDVEAMVERGIIVPGKAELSRLSQLVAVDLMPPAVYGAVLDPSDPTQAIKSVSVEDKALLTEWINTGPAPLRFENEPFTLGAAQFRRLLLDDLALVPPAERANYRYL